MISDIDPTWVAIRKHLEGELDKLRRQNDVTMSEIETATLRGRIGAVKNLLSLPVALAARAAVDGPQ